MHGIRLHETRLRNAAKCRNAPLGRLGADMGGFGVKEVPYTYCTWSLVVMTWPTCLRGIRCVPPRGCVRPQLARHPLLTHPPAHAT